MRHLIDFGDLTRQEWDEMYARASRIMDASRRASHWRSPAQPRQFVGLRPQF